MIRAFRDSDQERYRCGFDRRRSAGSVMVVVLLSVMLLAAMVFYVFNVGDHVASKVETQNAADATAISGARAVARSFNTVAMNNVEATRLISYVAVLDAVPQAVDYTILDQRSLNAAIELQLRRDPSTDGWIQDGLADAQLHIQGQLAMLEPIQELFTSEASAGGGISGGGYDVAGMTHYHAPGGGWG
ncbi:MAG: pilus assembly protein TadG-related protein [Planctomycetota bacterium]